MMKRSTTPITAYIDNMNKENITGKDFKKSVVGKIFRKEE
jgi:hypothetical protein